MQNSLSPQGLIESYEHRIFTLSDPNTPRTSLHVAADIFNFVIYDVCWNIPVNWLLKDILWEKTIKNLMPAILLTTVYGGGADFPMTLAVGLSAISLSLFVDVNMHPYMRMIAVIEFFHTIVTTALRVRGPFLNKLHVQSHIT